MTECLRLACPSNGLRGQVLKNTAKPSKQNVFTAKLSKMSLHKQMNLELLPRAILMNFPEKSRD